MSELQTRLIRLAYQRPEVRPDSARMLKRADQAARWTLTDPAFNLREIVKQLTLLEDHLAQPNKRCMDCIRKHLITVEAFAEEATAMDVTGATSKTSNQLAESARVWMEQVIDGRDFKEIAQEVRNTRKVLMPQVCDPRSRVASVADRYLRRNQLCEHFGVPFQGTRGRDGHS